MRPRKLEQAGIIIGYHVRLVPSAMTTVMMEVTLRNHRQPEFERCEGAVREMPDHLIRQIDGFLDLGWVRNGLAPFYSHTARPSIDPEFVLHLFYRAMVSLRLLHFATDSLAFLDKARASAQSSSIFRHFLDQPGLNIPERQALPPT